MRSDTPSVAIFGGGIAGLTCAHELAARGVDVTVYEANERFGGKARSVPISEEEQPLHGEHGFRFFPAYYRNVTDTMQRIPDGDNPRGVYDNLLSTDETLIAPRHGGEMTASTRTPRTVQEWLRSLEPNIGGGEVPRREARFFLRRLLMLLTSCQQRRESQWEYTSWWDFIAADQMSMAYRRYLGNSTQSLVALRPQTGSARTIGLIYLQLLRGQLDPTAPAERILDGPTSEAWIDPWVAHLETRGVDLRPNASVRKLHCDGRTVTGATVHQGGADQEVTADFYVAALPVEVLTRLLTDDLRRAAPSLARLDRLQTAWMSGIQYYLSADVPMVRGHGVYTDSPWALTSISQRQFWDEGEFDVVERSGGAVRGVLSVIASDWETPGVVYGKPARECTPAEIADEIWTQLQRHLNRNGRQRLTDDLLVDWFLDPELVETADGVENRAPLFINTVGSLRNRPEAGTEIENLLVAGDYVRTETDLATMESASEAGRLAVNALLDRAGLGPPCRTWGLDEPAIFEPLKRQDEIRYRLGLPHPGEVEDSVRRLVRTLTG